MTNGLWQHRCRGIAGETARDFLADRQLERPCPPRSRRSSVRFLIESKLGRSDVDADDGLAPVITSVTSSCTFERQARTAFSELVRATPG